MPKQKTKKIEYIRANIYIKQIDKEIFEWAKNQRQSLSEIIALALYEYRKKIENENHG